MVLTKAQFASTFPYHLIFDESLRLRQYGDSVAKLSPVQLREGMSMTPSFRVLHPRMSLTVANIRQFINTIFLIAVQGEQDTEGDGVFSMKGELFEVAFMKGELLSMNCLV